MVLKIEEGKFYRTREGKKAGPMELAAFAEPYARWRAPSLNNNYRSEWYEGGSFLQ